MIVCANLGYSTYLTDYFYMSFHRYAVISSRVQTMAYSPQCPQHLVQHLVQEVLNICLLDRWMDEWMDR